MLLQEAGIPDNVAYLVLGLAALVVIFGGWLVSFIVRLRGLRRDAALLAELEAEDGPVQTVVAPGTPAQAK